MIGTVAAISGMLVAGGSAAPAAPLVATVEISFATQAGEGAAGQKRFTREGCYHVESGGSTGGAGFARDSQAGCHLPADVAAAFARLDAVPADAQVREGTPAGGTGRGAPARGPAGGSETRVVLVRRDGSRWVAANRATSDDVLRAVNELPSENQWYAAPPANPIGKGPQIVVLSVTSGRSHDRRFEAALASDGRWWCHRSVIGARPAGDEPLPQKSASQPKDAAARLQRIFGDMSPQTRDDGRAEPVKRPDGSEFSVEGAWPGQERGPIRPSWLADDVTRRFAAEMKALSPACAVR